MKVARKAARKAKHWGLSKAARKAKQLVFRKAVEKSESKAATQKKNV